MISCCKDRGKRQRDIYPASHINQNMFYIGGRKSETEFVYSVNRDHSYTLTWNDQRHFKRNVVTFFGSDSSSPQDRYKICIQVKQWIVLVAGISVKYYTGTGTSAHYKKTLNGNSDDNLKEWCTEEREFLHVELTTSNGYNPQGLVHLHIKAVRTYHYQSFKETIVVAITGIVAYLILIAIVWVLRRQNHIERSSYGDKKTTQKLGNYSKGQA
ncbi:Hypothetical predicted protein [Mytilus galloprovincialis]|uniref:Uncharacterized protein n=1 Tax=Mytilus galloprovincialis TaxID=29158 RepID=A0A8B6FGH5_MYTGA|nr:Hypothetical predicted protein [Mytilus galloprovincialis]